MTPEEVDANEGMEAVLATPGHPTTLVSILHREGRHAWVKVSKTDAYNRRHEFVTPIQYLREIEYRRDPA